MKLHPYDQKGGVAHLENIDTLLMDLDKYGPDPHIHYHLGIEHYLYLMARQQLYTQEVSKIPDAVEVSQKLIEWEAHRNNWNITAYHFHQCTYYLQMRLTTSYHHHHHHHQQQQQHHHHHHHDHNNDEMKLQRSNVIGLLGYIHATFFNWDIAPSYYYLDLCLTHDPTSFFCIKSSMDAALAIGDYDTAYNNIKNYFKVIEPLSSSSSSLFSSSSSSSSSLSSTNSLQATCMLPIVFIKKLLSIYLDNSASQQETLYYVLLIAMVRYDDKLCPANAHINYVSDIISKDAVEGLSKSLKTSGITIDIKKSIRKMDVLSVCKDESFLEYLHQNDIKFHPCEKKASSSCSAFIDDIAPPTEQQHLAKYKEFLGALR